MAVEEGWLAVGGGWEETGFLEVEDVEGGASLGGVEGVESLAGEVERSVGMEGALGAVEGTGSGASSNSRGSDAESRGVRSGWRHAVER